MSVHLEAKQGEIAEVVLLPGDPLRAKYIAETYLEDVICYNKVRGMYGFTGTYKGHRISVQGSGMGMPSAAIYCTELIQSYGVKMIIRVGSCGGLQEDVHVRDVVLAQATATSSAIINNEFPHYSLPPIADFELLQSAVRTADEMDIPIKVGNVVSDDLFYKDSNDEVFMLAKRGVLCIEMETAVIYQLASKFNIKALGIMTVSDHLITGEETTAEEREKTFDQMIQLALEAAVNC